MNVQQTLSLLVILVVSLYASTAVSAPPSIVSPSVSGITHDRATLNAYINANNESTTVTFEYSSKDFTGQDDPAPQTVSAAPSLVTGSSYTAVSAELTSLAAGQRYFFRPVAVNASGTVSGDVFTFATTPAATATTASATTISTTGATLRGVVDPLGESTVVTFEYGPTASYGFVTQADQSPVGGSGEVPVTGSISGLAPDTVYHYRVVATNAYGTVSGEDSTFFTSAPALPAATTGEATFSLVSNTATLTGTVTGNNSATTVSFEYGTTTSYGTTVSADQSPVDGTEETPVSKYITALVPGTTYHFRVVASNSEGTVYGADRTFFNTTGPSAATEAASLVGNTTATLNGTVNPKTYDGGTSSWTTTVSFEYGPTASYGTTVTARESPLGGALNQNASAELTGLLPGTTYHYRVVAENQNGTSSGSDRTFTTTALASAETLTAAPVHDTSATLNGTVHPYGAATTVAFEYGLTDSYGNSVSADQGPSSATTATAFSTAVSGLLRNTTYHYRVRAANANGISYGADSTFTTGTPPPTVSTGAATSISSTSAVLHGTANANGLTTTVSFAYGTSPGTEREDVAEPSLVSGASGTAVALALDRLTPGTIYYYRLKAVNDGGTVYGPLQSFQTLAPPAVATGSAASVTTTGATLSGTVNANDLVSSVTFEYGPTTAYGNTVSADQSPVTGTADTPVSSVISGLSPSATYHYRVVATNAAGTSYGARGTFNTTAGPPAATTGYAVPFPTGGIVNGTVNASNSATTVTFEYGSTTAYGATVTADQSPVSGSVDTAVSATLSGLSFNTTYHYRITATNANGTTSGADRTFKTGLNPTAITLPASEIQATAATLNGEANGNNGGWNVSFDYGTTTSYGASVSATPSQVSGSTTTPVSADVVGLAPNMTYHYRVVLSGYYYGDDQTFTTLGGPTVVTDSASSVDSTAATLNATVTADGSDTRVIFEYGLDTGYGKSIAAGPAPLTGTSATEVSSQLLGLTPQTTYHYRAVATSSAAGTVNGADMTFSTAGAAPAAATEAASNVGLSSAVLNATVDANNDATTVTFEYGRNSSFAATVTADQSPLTGATPSAVQASVGGLVANSLYTYRVVARNSSGTTRGEAITFFTSASGPEVVTLAAKGIDPPDAVLHGTVNANGNVTAVFFEVGTDSGYGRSFPAVQSPVSGNTVAAVSAALSGVLKPEMTYHYRLVGQSAAGTAYGEDKTFFTGKQKFPWQVLLPGLVSPAKQKPLPE